MKSKKYAIYAKKKNCYEKEFKNKKNIRDHCHDTVKFRGAAHREHN